MKVIRYKRRICTIKVVNKDDNIEVVKEFIGEPTEVKAKAKEFYKNVSGYKTKWIETSDENVEIIPTFEELEDLHKMYLNRTFSENMTEPKEK